jgi:hypothetical protein
MGGVLPDDLIGVVCGGLDLCGHLQLAQACPAFWGWYATHWSELYVLHGQFAAFCQPVRRSRHYFLLYAMSMYENNHGDPVYGRAVRYRCACLGRRRRWAPLTCAAAVRCGRRCRRPPAHGGRFCAHHARRPLPLLWPPIFQPPQRREAVTTWQR